MQSNQKPLRCVVAGASGRMGRMLLSAVFADPRLTLAGALEQADSPSLGKDAGSLVGVTTGIMVRPDYEKVLSTADCLIDFTRPAGTLQHLKACRSHKVAAVIGTTGFSTIEQEQIHAVAQDIPIMLAPNMSLGVHAAFSLIAFAAKILGSGYDVEIIEAHHRHKVDAPSGTAIKMGEIISQARGHNLDEWAVFDRHTQTAARTSGQIGFSSIRGGDIIGDHTVLFAANGERIEISHSSATREPYALGAVRAALFLQGQKPGMYGMDDVFKADV